MLLLSVATFSCGCESDGTRSVWIADATPTAAPAGGMLRLTGLGFGTARVVDDALPSEDLDEVTENALADGVIFKGLDAITVGGVAARVFLRRDGRIDLQVPDVPAGSAFVVVWTQGVASNAFPVRILPVEQATE